MNIESRVGTASTTLVLEGRLDAFQVSKLREAVDRVMAQDLILRLDLAAVRYLDSTGIAELLRARSEATRVGGRLELYPVSDAVSAVLELTGMDGVFSQVT